MQAEPRILVVDDEDWVCVALSRLLQANGYHVETACDGADGKDRIERGRYDVIVVDLTMKDIGGMDLLRLCGSLPHRPEVLLMSAYGTVESAVEAIKLGAFDYLTKPLDSRRVLLTVAQALERHALKAEVTSLRKQVGERFGSRNIICASAGMRKVLELVDVVSRTDSTVLVEGESGTGKELVARAIHFDGPRAAGPFVTVNCAALPEPLLESELFGHVKGAFTGALQDKKGLFEEADGGTLFLDEIGDMPLSIQVKVLRALQDGEIRKVGGNSTHQVNARIIACTNRGLKSLVAVGKFREDLFYRLNVIPISMPPLRERREDIVPLASHFVEKFRVKLHKPTEGFSPEALTLLLTYDWPGNVRELENLVERMVALSSSPLVSRAALVTSLCLEDVTEAAPPAAEGGAGLQATRRMLEREQILRSLAANDGSRAKAASDLGISRTSLWRKIKRYGLDGDRP